MSQKESRSEIEDDRVAHSRDEYNLEGSFYLRIEARIAL